MADKRKDQSPTPKSQSDTKARKIYCDAPNPDYPGRYCTKMTNPDGSHVNGGDHSDGTYSW